MLDDVHRVGISGYVKFNKAHLVRYHVLQERANALRHPTGSFNSRHQLCVSERRASIGTHKGRSNSYSAAFLQRQTIPSGCKMLQAERKGDTKQTGPAPTRCTFESCSVFSVLMPESVNSPFLLMGTYPCGYRLP